MTFLSSYTTGTGSPDTPDEHSSPPAVVLAALGVALLAIVAWNFERELSGLAVALPPVLAAVIGTGLSAAVLYASYWLARSDLAPSDRWRVSWTGVGGAVAGVVLFGLTIVVRIAEGRPIAEPQFVLFTAGGGGAVAGTVIGILYARARRDARAAETAREAEARARKEAEEARAETEAALADAEETRDQLRLLNRILRHDVLNSITVIRARAELVADEASGRLQSFAETIVVQSDDVAEQIERTRAVLDALADEGNEPRPLDIVDVIDGEVETLRNSFDVSVELDLPDGQEVLADDLLPDVVANLLTNAVQHHDGDHPRLEVTVEKHSARDDTGEVVVCRVADDGPGIPDGRKAEVTSRGVTTGDGSGFGLFFVTTMMDQYGGDVRVTDSDLGGAAFELVFRAP